MEAKSGIDTPGQIYEILTGYWKTGVLKASVELDLFTEIAKGTNTADKMAEALQVSERGLKTLLNALCSMNILGKKGETYILSPIAERFLLSTKSSYVGQAVKSFVPPEAWEAWGQVSKAIKKGGPVRETPPPETYWVRVAEGLVPFGASPARTMCDLLDISDGTKKSLRVLDLACGSGIYGYTILQRDSLATVTDLDLQQVLEYAKTIAIKMGVIDRVTYQVGDILDSDYGEELFEIAIISNILQGFDPDTIKTILAKVFRALSPGGAVVIHEFVPDENRTAETFSLLFAVFMFLETEGGGTYTFSEFSRWLSDVGYFGATLHRLSEPTALIIAEKPDK